MDHPLSATEADQLDVNSVLAPSLRAAGSCKGNHIAKFEWGRWHRHAKRKHQRNPLFFGLMCPVILARGYRIGGL